MTFVARSKEGEEASERTLVARLRRFVEDSDLSFYKTAWRVGTSGGILSMWLAGIPIDGSGPGWLLIVADERGPCASNQ